MMQTNLTRAGAAFLLLSVAVACTTSAKSGDPTASSQSPLNSATGVGTNASMSVTFSQAMNPATINASTFTVTQGANAVTGTVSYSGVTATFKPTAVLAANELFTATVSTGAQDSAGVALANPIVWTFTTGAALNLTLPTVSATIPLNAAISVALGSSITATFSTVMDPLSINSSTFTLTQGSTAIPGIVAYTGVTATFIPTAVLLGNAAFTATITTGAKDLAGNALATAFVWTFTTGSVLDSLLPTVSATIPLNAAIGVAIGGDLAVTFSEAMDPLTITAATFTLNQGTTAIPGVVISSGVTALFTSTAVLTANTLYTATISTGAKDLAGNALATSFVWTFTTGTVLDTLLPTVSATIPLNAATAVALGGDLAATFSEAMDPLSITSSTFTLKQGATAVPGVVVSTGVTAIFTATTVLTASTVYTASVSTAARDLAGNALATDFTWTFTTGTTLDTLLPTVSSTIPLNAATAVALGGDLAATFSEAMDPLTINSATFTVKQGATNIPGVVVSTGTSAIFTAASPLAATTTYTATISTGAKDLAGNALASPFSWTFTTGSSLDTLVPTITSMIPMSAATGVALGTTVAAVFSEAIDPLSITAATFTLTQGTATVSGIVASSGTTATFTPDAALTANAAYTATITTGAMDLAGNPLAAAVVWTFTTGAALDTTLPTVTLTVPVNAATAVAIGGNLAVTFSEIMNPMTVSSATFTVMHGTTAIAGIVGYSGTTATFNSVTALTAGTAFTATITTGVKDLSGNALAEAYTWTFTTGSAVDTTPPTVSSTLPLNAATGTALASDLFVTFSKAMNSLTITPASFTLTQGSTAVAGTITYAGDIATFIPAKVLAASTTFTATITTAAKDLAGNALAAPFTWTFTTGFIPALPVNLKTAGNYVILAQSAITGTLTSAITGDMGISPAAATLITGFDLQLDAATMAFSTSTQVVGKVYAADYEGTTPLTLGTAITDLGAAVTDATSRLPDVTALGAGNIGGATIPPGVYQWSTDLSIPTNVSLVGSATDVWVFQVAQDLNMSNAASIVLSGGALASNIFWQVTGAVTLGTTAHLEGVVLCHTAITLGTGASVTGRLLAGTSVGVDVSTVTAPAP